MKNKDIARWFIIICIVGLATTKILEFNKEKHEEKEAFNQLSQEEKNFAIDYILNKRVENFPKISEDVDIITLYCKRQTEYKILSKNLGITLKLLIDDHVQLNEKTKKNLEWNEKLHGNVSNEQWKLESEIRETKNVKTDEICK